jgi:hypothetical protein
VVVVVVVAVVVVYETRNTQKPTRCSQWTTPGGIYTPQHCLLFPWYLLGHRHKWVKSRRISHRRLVSNIWQPPAEPKLLTFPQRSKGSIFILPLCHQILQYSVTGCFYTRNKLRNGLTE